MHKAWQTLQRKDLALVGAGVLAGVTVIAAIVFWLLPGHASLEATAAPQDIGIPSSEFFTVVIFGVDDLKAESPSLGAVWIGTFEIMNREGVLMGLPRTFQLSNGESMDYAFAWSSEDGLNAAFLSAVEGTLGLIFDTALVMDESCYQAIIDFIGGVPMDGDQQLDGRAALALHQLSAGDPWTALEVQAEILDQARLRLATMSDIADFSRIWDLTPDQCWLTINDDAALELLLRILPVAEDSLRIETISPFN